MKITIEATAERGTINGTPCRIWSGVTDAGTPCHVAVVGVAVDMEHDEAFGRESEGTLENAGHIDLPSALKDSVRNTRPLDLRNARLN